METETSASIESAADRAISIAPNPVVSDHFQLRLDHTENGQASWQILSLTGQVLREQQLYLDGGTYQEDIPTNTLARGTYLLRWRDEQGEQTQRFAVQ